MTGLPCSGKTSIACKLQEYVPNLAVLDRDFGIHYTLL